MENKSSFQFKGYRVKKSLIEILDSSSDELTVNFEPSGIIDNKSNIFILNFNIHVFDESKNVNIEVEFVGEFSFVKKDENFENFLYINAPALIFPYVRSYLTALTALSGVQPITLPTMNLIGLKDQLSKNITENS